ncbi:hypothetical protein ACTACT_03085 [Pseudomonas syringae]|uniref:hypothetical protein n=1 Tax=Pseudomonas syringae TaxID=317 RepID=UPI003F74D00F
MNPVFKTLTKAILENVEDQLANNEDADDGELWDFMVEELGLTGEQADAAVALRPLYRCEIYFTGQSPLYQSNSISFDPREKKLVSVEPFSFDQVIAVYRTLLQGRPGYRLKLGSHWAAGLNPEGQLYCTQLDPCDPDAVFEVFEFTRDAWVDGHWQCETQEQTRSAIDTPVFIK